MNTALVTVMNKCQVKPHGKCVIYWMDRAQRGEDNPALSAAIERANELKLPLVVFFGLFPQDLHESERTITFQVEGLREVSADLRNRRIRFVVRKVQGYKGIIRLAEELDASEVFSDESHLRTARLERAYVAEKLRVPFSSVDADVIVPVRFIGCEQHSAHTFRAQIQHALAQFLVETPTPAVEIPSSRLRIAGMDLESDNSSAIVLSLGLARSVPPSPFFRGGRAEATRRLEIFLNERLTSYAKNRNDFLKGATSNLSPYIRYGQISVHRIAASVRAAAAPKADRLAFLDELIARRELAENFCYYNDHYDSLEGLPEWAFLSLKKHSYDPREHIYTLPALESSSTHDPLWNAAQRQLVLTGKMHPYLRMLWAKKILEWTDSPAEALKVASFLNDKYSLDGRSPAGYAGVAWAIGGKHDCPCPERPVYGKVRSISSDSACTRSDCKSFIEAIERLEKDTQARDTRNSDQLSRRSRRPSWRRR